jgi:ribosomal protein L23
MALFGTKKTEAKKASTHAGKARAAKLGLGAENDIIRAPWISEKALLGTDSGVYVFEVSPRATKAEIAGAIAALYKVTPRKIRVVRLPAKQKNMRSRRGTGSRAARHKAYVYLSTGDTIQFA